MDGNNLRSQKERNQVMELRTHDFDSEELTNFVKQWNYIDQHRIGLDDQINEILKEIDLTAILNELKKGSKAGVQKATILQEVIDKIQERMDELARIEAEKAEKESEEDYMANLDADNIEDFAGPLELQGDNQQSKKDLMTGEGGEDFWLVQNALKVDRIKNKIDGDAKKQKRAKSAGEMALLFMGINKIAYDLLLENPMTGYMNEIIFTRVLGVDDIYQGGLWKDTSQCWVCEKWDKTKIKYSDNDKKLFA